MERVQELAKEFQQRVQRSQNYGMRLYRPPFAASVEL